jgi:uncharacterized protein YkwD
MKKAIALAGVFALVGLVALFSFGSSNPALAAPPEGEQPNADPTGSPAEGHKIAICHNGHLIEVNVHAQPAHENHDHDVVDDVGDDIVLGGVLGGADVAEPAGQGEGAQDDAEAACSDEQHTQEQPEGSQPPGEEQTEETQQQQQGLQQDATGVQQAEEEEPEENVEEQPSESGGTETVETCDGESMELKGEEERTLELHNEVRERHSLEPLCVDPELTRAARSHSKDMIQKGYFAHASPSGETLGARLERSGYEYRTAGENIAWGTGPLATPEDTMDRWMGSPGHRRNVLDGGFREVGVGAATGEYERGGGHAATMYTVDFGTPRS